MQAVDIKLGPLIFLSISLLLQSCSSIGSSSTIEPLSSPTPTAAHVEEAAYPGPLLENSPTQLSYPPPNLEGDDIPVTVSPVELPLTLLASAPGSATIGGVIVDERTQQAPPESLLYLAPMLYTDKGLPVVSLDRQRDPFVVLPPNGLFVFENVLPGEYSLVFLTPDYSFLVEQRDTQESLIVTVEPDDIIDLGLIELPAR